MTVNEMNKKIKDYCDITLNTRVACEKECKLFPYLPKNKYGEIISDCFRPDYEESNITDEEIIRNYNIIFDDNKTETSHIKEMVNHPSHYQGNKFEVIDIIEDYNLDFCLGNAVKYILRAGKKDDIIQDINKAIWYLERFKESKNG